VGIVQALFTSPPEPTRHKERLVNRRFLRRRFWLSLALVGSNFLGHRGEVWVVVRRAIGSLPSEDAAIVLLFSLVASGQIRLRRIGGWRKIATVLRRQTSRAA